jgi:hypothetical protein
MMRTVLIQIGLFALPFAVYALYLALRKKNPLTGGHWTAAWVLGLGVGGLFLSLVLFTLIAQNAGLQLSGRNAEHTTAP